MTLDSTMSFINKDKNATNSAMTNFSREKSQNKSYDDVQDSELPSSYTHLQQQQEDIQQDS
jgi:hypothetical protein